VAEVLVEIGFEEMPAPWLPGLAEQLREGFVVAAERESLTVEGAAALWTPRRLVLRAQVPAGQADREEEVFGPALKVARGPAGEWTKAALGFARKSGVSLDELGEGAKDPSRPDERYLRLVRKVLGRPTAEILPGLLAAVLRGLSFPKRMSWDAWLDDGRGAFPFGRPIRWLVVMIDGRVVPFVIHALEGGTKGPGLVESGRATRGHRFLPRERGGEAVGVSSFEELRDRLRERFCLVEPKERARLIDEALAATASSFDDHGLREEWRDLVEYPTVVVGEVPAEFRSLPDEVLETVLVHHQKSISLRDGEGRIARFAAITNGDGSARAEIVRGLERVVIARLRDAAFFLAEDRKRPLRDRAPELGGVTFHRGLGSYLDKAKRLERLVDAMARSGHLSAAQAEAAARAAGLAKADLVTLMVREFPELQGVMGGVYLEAEGAPDVVATAVRWHYHPIAVEPEAAPAAAFAGQDEKARVFAAVSLADKLDTLAGYFGLGESPTGSRDPYGLRRAGQGAVRAVLDFWRPRDGEAVPDLGALLAEAVGGYESLKVPAEETARLAAAFLLDRLGYVLTARGVAADEVAAVVAGGDGAESGRRALADPMDALARGLALQRVRREVPEDFAALAEAFKRAKNILAQAQPGASVDPALFEAEAERALHRAATALSGADGSYEERLRGLSALRAPVGKFFDDVLVMAEKAEVRANRLALLDLTLSLFYRIADISKLGGTS
jgi:glycyl-tRNA synthetase beta chain